MENDYSAYGIEDLVSDESFIEWINHGHHNAFWEDWMKAHPEREGHVQEAAALVKAMTESSFALTPQQKNKLWNRIRQSTDKKPGIRRLYIAAGIAASFALIVYFTGLWRENPSVHLVNQTQKVIEHVLPDQSVVALAPGSFIQYSETDFNGARIVYMEGKAFFEVTKGSSFRVNCKMGLVEVLGTSFDVVTTGSELMVKCYSGKVNVISGEKQVMLMPGEQTSFENKAAHKKNFNLNSNQQPEWMESSVKFENAALHDVILQLEQMYNIKVQTADSLLIGKKHTGTLVDNDLEKALMSITWPHHLSFELEGNLVKITEKIE